MRNPNRTTKGERRAVRASNPIVSRVMGVAAAARLQRQRAARSEAAQLDRLARALGIEPLMTEPRDQAERERAEAFMNQVCAAMTERYLRPALAEAGLDPDAYEYGMQGYRPGFTVIDEPNPDEVPYPTVESVTVEPDGWLTLKYAPHISTGKNEEPHD